MFAKLAQYPTFQVFLTISMAFVLTSALMPLFIRALKSRRIGQQVRADGPQGHLVKEGTPTMGGVIVLLVAAISFGLMAYYAQPDATVASANKIASFHYSLRGALLVCFTTLSCGLLGFVDDYAKVAKERSLGLKPMAKIIGQFVIATITTILAVNWVGISVDLQIPATAAYIPLHHLTSQIPWFAGATLLIPWAYLAFALVMIIGMSNAVNLTDGLDGLAAGTVMIVALVFAAIAYSQDNLPVALIAAAITGACIGFLWYNSYPADIFMGDTGSLGLGGGIAALAAVTKTELLLIVIGGIFVIEALSVVIQVVVYKRTKRRVFKMAPIHHHFEMVGWSETKIMVRFWVITGVLAGLGFAIYFFQSTRLGA